jgi:hypothetical protein
MIMKTPLHRLFPFLVLALCPLWALAADKPSKAPELPELPEALRSLEPSKRSHEGTPAARLQRKDGLLLLSLSTSKPLTDAQWDAVASLQPKAFGFNDQSLCDKDMDRLVALDPVSITLRITPVTGVGAAKFGLMKNLRSLTSHHLHQATPEAKDALANHQTLEDFRSAGDFCIEALSAPHLKSVELAEKAATVARIQELVQKPSLETLSLFAHNITTIDDASLATVSKIQSLQTLRLAFTVLTYDGGLKQLQALPNLKSLSLYQVDLSPADLQRCKDTFPSVKVNHTPMTPDYRAKWDAMIAKQTNPAKK